MNSSLENNLQKLKSLWYIQSFRISWDNNNSYTNTLWGITSKKRLFLKMYNISKSYHLTSVSFKNSLFTNPIIIHSEYRKWLWPYFRQSHLLVFVIGLMAWLWFWSYLIHENEVRLQILACVLYFFFISFLIWYSKYKADKEYLKNLVLLENNEFEDILEVKCNDPVFARQYIDPHRLQKMYDRLHTNDLTKWTHFFLIWNICIFLYPIPIPRKWLGKLLFGEKKEKIISKELIEKLIQELWFHKEYSEESKFTPQDLYDKKSRLHFL